MLIVLMPSRDVVAPSSPASACAAGPVRPGGRSRRARRPVALLAFAALGAGCLGVGVPQGAAVASPVGAVQAPSAEELTAAREAAERSRAAADSAQEQLAAAQAALDALAAQAGAALERYQTAMEAQAAAVAEEAAQRQRLAEAEATLAEGKKDLGQWASQAYREGGSLREYSSLVTALQQTPTDETASALASVKRIGDGRSSAVDAYEEAQRVQADATARAEAAAAEARTQAELAVAAKQEADALVARQRDEVAGLATLQQTAAGTALTDEQRAANLEKAKLEAEARAAAAAATAGASGTSVSGELVGPVGECAGASTAGYANGLIPRSALCPIWAAPGHVLRADAAEAFNRLSQAYSEAFGTPLSVTDSYRTLAGQIDVARRKPGLAARPGTSRHGLGIAVDLGGGVQNASSAQHQWMDRNAALYGWINPGWAQNRGGQFEPWHWEYVG
ncbi:M15 family metallopeptidase [Kineococcus sp. TRM81007]|uniref:M15 family metallopeptidase n=1 Tax=Kineococcus sp. TRM81007 TaxID=2925831 RepID=UPI001F57C690|nr:M15 family metallopeptidase [Kineococcus sp. TRM81007]MCI2237734.1 M15 family metallopeptidase [Kineococcus sp. TRM81007]